MLGRPAIEGRHVIALHRLVVTPVPVVVVVLLASRGVQLKLVAGRWWLAVVLRMLGCRRMVVQCGVLLLHVGAGWSVRVIVVVVVGGCRLL